MKKIFIFDDPVRMELTDTLENGTIDNVHAVITSAGIDRIYERMLDRIAWRKADNLSPINTAEQFIIELELAMRRVHDCPYALEVRLGDGKWKKTTIEVITKRDDVR